MGRASRKKQNRRDGTRQHYIPQCYLRWFLDPDAHRPDPWVWTVDIEGILKGGSGRAKNRSPVNLFVERGFYDRATPRDDLRHLEDVYGDIERAARPVLERIAMDGPAGLNNDDRWALCEFMGSQATRTPQYRLLTADAAAVLGRRHLSSILTDDDVLRESLASYRAKHPSSQLTPELLKETLSRSPPTIRIKRDGVLDLAVNAAERYALDMMYSDWQWWRAPEGADFITSDQPVSRLGFEIQPDGRPLGEFMMTVCPRYRLRVHGRPRSGGWRTEIRYASGEQVQSLNSHLLSAGCSVAICSREETALSVVELLTRERPKFIGLRSSHEERRRALLAHAPL